MNTPGWITTMMLAAAIAITAALLISAYPLYRAAEAVVAVEEPS